MFEKKRAQSTGGHKKDAKAGHQEEERVRPKASSRRWEKLHARVSEKITAVCLVAAIESKLDKLEHTSEEFKDELHRDAVLAQEAVDEANSTAREAKRRRKQLMIESMGGGTTTTDNDEEHRDDNDKEEVDKDEEDEQDEEDEDGGASLHLLHDAEFRKRANNKQVKAVLEAEGWQLIR